MGLSQKNWIEGIFQQLGFFFFKKGAILKRADIAKSLQEVLMLQGDIICLSEILGMEQLIETKKALQENGFYEIYSIESFQLPRDPKTNMYNIIGSRSTFTLQGSFWIPGGPGALKEELETTGGLLSGLVKECISRATKNIWHGNVSHLEFQEFSLIFGHVHMLKYKNFMTNFLKISYPDKPTIVVGDYNASNIFHNFMQHIGFKKLIQERTFFPCNNIYTLGNLLKICTIHSPDVLYTKGFVYKTMGDSGQGNHIASSIKTIEYQIVPHQRSDHSIIQAILYL